MLPLPAAPPSPTRAAPAPPPQGLPLLRLGFRPFYLGAATFGAVAVPYWVALIEGRLSAPMAVSPLLWHAHELLFGFVAAVLVGFLLTAGRAWTGLATPRGPHLAALVGLWGLARLTALAAPYPVHALLDALLLPWVAGVFTRLLWRASNRRNLPLAGLLGGLALVNLAFHAAVMGWLPLEPLRALHAALALLVLIECVIAGRVIPAFTGAALPGLALHPSPSLERLTLGLSVAALSAWILLPQGRTTALLLAGAALLHVLRLQRWKPWQTRHRPILWVLHGAYAWLPVGLGLLSAGAAGLLGVSAGVHALAVGATGGLIIAMITRTARGHTGRALKASRREVAAYGLVALAGVLRVFGPMSLPAHRALWLVGAALAWSLAFCLYLSVFTPWLMASRIDGRDG